MYLERVVRFVINNFVSLREKRTTKRVFFHSDFRNACVQIGFLVKVRSPEKKRGKREKPLVLHAVSVAEKRDYEIAIVVAQFFAYFLIFCSFFLHDSCWCHIVVCVQAPARYLSRFSI